MDGQKIVQMADETYGPLEFRTYWIYGSAQRPISASWARIKNARYIYADHSIDGYYTWIIVPQELPISVIESYELTPDPVYGPITLRTEPQEQSFAQGVCPKCGHDWTAHSAWIANPGDTTCVEAEQEQETDMNLQDIEAAVHNRLDLLQRRHNEGFERPSWDEWLDCYQAVIHVKAAMAQEKQNELLLRLCIAVEMLENLK